MPEVWDLPREHPGEQVGSRGRMEALLMRKFRSPVTYGWELKVLHTCSEHSPVTRSVIYI